MTKTSKKNRVIINSVLGVLGVIWMLPVLFSVLNMFKSRQEYNMGSFWDLPAGNFILENVQYVQENAKIFQGMFSSLLYAVCGSVFAVIIGTLAAYGIAHLKIKHRMFWFMVIYSGTIFPFQIYLIPIFKGYSKLGLYDTRLGMILFYTASASLLSCSCCGISLLEFPEKSVNRQNWMALPICRYCSIFLYRWPRLRFHCTAAAVQFLLE